MEVNTLFLEFNLLVDKMDVSLRLGSDGHGLHRHVGPALAARTSGRAPAGNHLWWPKQKTPGFPWEKRIDEIFDQGVQELDKSKRKAMYGEWIEIVYDEQPFIYLTVPERVDGDPQAVRQPVPARRRR